MRNLLIGAALLAWLILIVGCTITKQWPAVVALFALAWFVEQSIACTWDKE